MDSAKGLLDMVTALSLLVNAGEDVILDLVGWPEKNSGILEEIRAQSQNEGVADRVIYHGYRPVGPELFEFYKQADIYVIASQSSEGFPRTIWEAMANGLPVVATRVGSIPDFIEGSAVLIEPKHQIELAQGISQIIYDPHLRKRNIEGGYSLSMENTIEIQSKKMVDLLIEWKLKNG
jgi:glycosyltransferase involved in cell wall biosynthesis